MVTTVAVFQLSQDGGNGAYWLSCIAQEVRSPIQRWTELIRFQPMRSWFSASRWSAPDSRCRREEPAARSEQTEPWRL